MVPIEICLRIQDFSLPQYLCHLSISDAIGEKSEYHLHHFSRRRIDNEFMSILWIFLITEWCMGTKVHPLLWLYGQLLFWLTPVWCNRN